MQSCSPIKFDIKLNRIYSLKVWITQVHIKYFRRRLGIESQTLVEVSLIEDLVNLNELKNEDEHEEETHGNHSEEEDEGGEYLNS